MTSAHESPGPGDPLRLGWGSALNSSAGQAWPQLPRGQGEAVLSSARSCRPGHCAGTATGTPGPLLCESGFFFSVFRRGNRHREVKSLARDHTGAGVGPGRWGTWGRSPEGPGGLLQPGQEPHTAPRGSPSPCPQPSGPGLGAPQSAPPCPHTLSPGHPPCTGRAPALPLGQLSPPPGLRSCMPALATRAPAHQP